MVLGQHGIEYNTALEFYDRSVAAWLKVRWHDAIMNVDHRDILIRYVGLYTLVDVGRFLRM